MHSLTMLGTTERANNLVDVLGKQPGICNVARDFAGVPLASANDINSDQYPHLWG